MARRVRKTDEDMGDKPMPIYGPVRDRRLWAKYGGRFDGNIEG